MGERSSITRTRQSAAALKQPSQEALFDTHTEVSLDFEVVREAARQSYTQPFLILDTALHVRLDRRDSPGTKEG